MLIAAIAPPTSTTATARAQATGRNVREGLDGRSRACLPAKAQPFVDDRAVADGIDCGAPPVPPVPDCVRTTDALFIRTADGSAVCQARGERPYAGPQLLRAPYPQGAAEPGKYRRGPVERADAHPESRAAVLLGEVGQRARDPPARLLDRQVEQHVDLPRPRHLGERP